MRNLTMMTDLYQLTMMYGYYKFGMTKTRLCSMCFSGKICQTAAIPSWRALTPP